MHNLMIENYIVGNDETTDLCELINRCKVNIQNYNENLLRLAFNYCIIAHEGRLAVNGKKYYTHPLSVAYIVIKEIPLDMDAVIVALLHNVLDESDIYTFEDIRFAFGDNIASIVREITRIKLVESQHIERSDQIDNYRKLLLTLFKDIRIILVKLADKLDNMRTLGQLPEYFQKQFAKEVLDIYAPFANRFGLIRIKFELEDLAFRYLSPEIYKQIEGSIKDTHHDRTQYIERFKIPIVELLEAEGLLKKEAVKYRINGRAKNIYSIYNKTLLRNKRVEELYDIFAIRIILSTDNPLFCYYVYGIVGMLYKPIPETFKDYISTPKENGYKSLHTAVAGPGGRIVEVQIRTQAMHQASEFGIAAHFRYKSGLNNSAIFEDKNIGHWLDEIRYIFEQIGKEDSQKLLSLVLTPRLDNKIYVFTPKNEFKEFPQGSVVLDFAFSIHTDLGIRCLGAKINGKFYPVNHVLNNGDRIEVLISNRDEAQKEWLDFVVTPLATTKLINFCNKGNTPKHSNTISGKALPAVMPDDQKQAIVQLEIIANNSERILETILETIITYNNNGQLLECLYDNTSSGLIKIVVKFTQQGLVLTSKEATAFGKLALDGSMRVPASEKIIDAIAELNDVKLVRRKG